jgi:hypothetical protein
VEASSDNSNSMKNLATMTVVGGHLI